MAFREPTRGARFITAGAAAALATALAVVVFSLNLLGRRGASESLYHAAVQARQTAEAHLRAQRCDEAEQACHLAGVILDKLADRAAGEPRYRRERAALAETRGLCQFERGASDEAVPAFKEAIDLWSKLLAESPAAFEERSRLAACLSRLGILYRDAGRWDEAESTISRGRLLCETLPANLRDDPRVARSRVGFLDQLGRLFVETGRPSEALTCDTIAVTAQQALVSSAAGTSEDREVLVALAINLAGDFTIVRRPLDAERTLVGAGDVADLLRADFPTAPRYDDLVATVLELRASAVNSDTNRHLEARELLGRALSIREKLVARAPAALVDVAKLAAACDTFASLCRDHGAFDQAESFYRKALSCHSRLTGQDPGAPLYRFDRGRALHNLADLLRGRGRRDEAISLARQAVEELGVLYSNNRDNSEYRTAFSYARWMLCALLLDDDDVQGAAEAVAEYRKIEPSGYEEPLEAARFLGRCARLWRPDSRRPKSHGEPSADTYADQAMSALSCAVQNGFRDLHDLKTSSVYDPLRTRDDFQRLLREVELKGEK
jgi:eukaryotic-like serine/threonine-protein kinase